MSVEIFGRLPDGQAVERVTISGGGLTAKVMGWGAALQDLRLTGHPAPLVLGFETFESYPAHSPHFGATAGRCANRIGGGRFVLDGRTFETDKNFLDAHTLHGGSAGTGKRVWRLADHSESSARFVYRAVDGEMGFPGNLDMSCSYSVLPEGRLVIEMRAETDRPTLCNLAHHSYFNLDDGGRTDVLGHFLRIEAGAYLPVDDQMIPTGAVVPVEGTVFDFRSSRAIRNGAGESHRSYDHNFCLSACRTELRRVVTAHGARSSIELEVWTTEPGVQFYDGARSARQVPGLDGIAYGAYAGFCLEPQVWPDAPHRAYFPQATLRPGQQYAQTTEYRFRETAQ